MRMEQRSVASQDTGVRQSTKLRSGGDLPGGRKRFSVIYNSFSFFFNKIKKNEEEKNDGKRRQMVAEMVGWVEVK